MFEWWGSGTFHIFHRKGCITNWYFSKPQSIRETSTCHFLSYSIQDCIDSELYPLHWNKLESWKLYSLDQKSDQKLVDQDNHRLLLLWLEPSCSFARTEENTEWKTATLPSPLSTSLTHSNQTDDLILSFKSFSLSFSFLLFFFLFRKRCGRFHFRSSVFSSFSQFFIN